MNWMKYVYRFQTSHRIYLSSFSTRNENTERKERSSGDIVAMNKLLLLLLNLLRQGRFVHTSRALPLSDLRDACIQQTVARLGLPGLDGFQIEEQFDLLDGLTGRLGVGEEGLDGSADAEDAEDDEEFPRDVLECGRDEEPDREIEQPVRDRGQRHACGAGFERPDLGGVNPSYRGEGDGVDNDEDVAERDDGVGGGTGDLDPDAEVAVQAGGEICSIGS